MRGGREYGWDKLEGIAGGKSRSREPEGFFCFYFFFFLPLQCILINLGEKCTSRIYGAPRHYHL